MITEYHFDNLAKLTLFTGSILFYSYAMEYFIAWYSGDKFELFVPIMSTAPLGLSPSS